MKLIQRIKWISHPAKLRFPFGIQVYGIRAKRLCVCGKSFRFSSTYTNYTEQELRDLRSLRME